ncbi:unnamed protein product [Adineta steineri]|uniref:Uncharacterized protein n=1 Tax=Adineta steineri TaxID=433720 RepID=A0A818RV52_9BILA|nr:unnamed protein product [Adineta steineri]CAF1290869.1 unnamed protein product [Adineta steineri]CAF3659750.1 unnamed protein product [Adineta steineri]CAF3683459.1 unnamed protein product [Adineta steineri]
MTDSTSNSTKENFSNFNQSGQFARSRWSHVLALADQLRHNTEIQKDEQLRQYAFDIPTKDIQIKSSVDNVQSFENALLFAKTGNFNLDNLSEKYIELKHTFNHMLELNKHDIQQVKLATSITKTALLLLLRAIESIVEVTTKGTRKYPTLNSLISYIRSRQTELPIHGKLLVDWYSAAQILDLLVNDPDWLVQPRKAYWAMQVCNETLAWTRGVFNENYRRKSLQRPIYDREDSIIVPALKDKE